MNTETELKAVNPLLVSTIVKKYLGHHRLSAADIPTLIATVHTALQQVATPSEPAETALTPAVPIRRSVTRDAVICLVCGKRCKMLRRHLHTSHGLTPDEYRARWGLRPDYPMSAPSYSEARSAMAKQLGLGQYGGRRTEAVVSAPETETAERPDAGAADEGLDPAFQASLGQPRRRRSRRSEPPAAE